MKMMGWSAMGLLLVSIAGCDQVSARLKASFGDGKPNPELLSPDRTKGGAKGDPPSQPNTIQPTTIQPPPVASNSNGGLTPAEPPKEERIGTAALRKQEPKPDHEVVRSR
ncbi:MAG: hypothetical protein RLY67_304 [Pseudomonadota bacterium]|jgi:hypothetical protein